MPARRRRDLGNVELLEDKRVLWEPEREKLTASERTWLDEVALPELRRERARARLRVGDAELKDVWRSR